MPRASSARARRSDSAEAPLSGTQRLRAGWQHVARQTVEATGSPWAFLLALLIIATWAATGPIFHFSDTWQLVINTGTTIVTFLMVFLIQQSQNRDTKALHAKLNELIAAVEGASNRLIDVEDLSEEDLTKLHEQYRQLAKTTLADHNDTARTSLSDIAPPVDRTLAALRPESDDDTPPPPQKGVQRRGRPS